MSFSAGGTLDPEDRATCPQQAPMNRKPILEALDNLLTGLATKGDSTLVLEATRAIARARGRILISDEWPWDKELLEALGWIVHFVPGNCSGETSNKTP